MATKSGSRWFNGLRAALESHRESRRLHCRRDKRSPKLLLEALENRLVPASISIADSSVIEPGPGDTANMDFTVTRTGDVSQLLTVGYRTVPGTALDNSDFTPMTGTAVFPPGAATAVIAIPIFGDGIYNNPSLTFSVELTGIAGGVSPPLTFADHVDFPSGKEPVAVAVGDLNGDGKPDLVVAGDYSTVSVLLNTTQPGSATPSFAPPQIFNVGVYPAGLALADVNGDGRPDIILLSVNAMDYGVSVLLNTTAPGAAAASFAPQNQFPTGGRPTSLAIGDLNGDGKPDIVVAEPNNSAVSVLLNTTAPGATVSSFVQQSFSAGYAPGTVTLADFNGDGKPDIVASSNNNGGSVSVLLNTTFSGASVTSFEPLQSIGVGYRTLSVVASDINGDGKPDLIVINQPSSNSNSISASIFLGTTPVGAPTVSFAPEQSIVLNNYPASILPADINGDGKPDLVLAADNYAMVSVLLNTTAPGAAEASFPPPQTFATGNVSEYSSSRQTAVADINGDGKPDLIVPNYDDNTVSVLLNTTSPVIARGTAIGTILESDPRNDVVVNGTSGDDTLIVNRTLGGGVGSVTYVLNGGAPVVLTGVTSLTFNGLGGNDTLRVGPGNGAPLIAGPGPVVFNGGVGDSSLVVDTDGQATRVVPGTITISGPQTIAFANVSSIRIENAVSVDASTGPDTVDREMALAGLTPNERFVELLYLDDLGRPGSMAELDGWAGMLSNGSATQASVAFAIDQSEEGRDHLVKGWYVSYLGRQAGNGEELGLVNDLQTGQTNEQVLSAIFASSEFFNRAQSLVFTGAPDQRYVDALFQLLLNRDGSESDISYWVGALGNVGRQSVALDFLASTEFREDQFEGYYDALLHRPGDVNGLDYWAALNLDIDTVRVAFEANDEFFANG
jgi:FG-GAP-like repeat/Calx-beta domain/Domain of unknown function (DUF4214)/FG-GAP repeat